MVEPKLFTVTSSPDGVYDIITPGCSLVAEGFLRSCAGSSADTDSGGKMTTVWPHLPKDVLRAVVASSVEDTTSDAEPKVQFDDRRPEDIRYGRLTMSIEDMTLKAIVQSVGQRFGFVKQDDVDLTA